MAKKTEQKIQEELKKLYGDKAMLDGDLNRLEQQYANGITNLDNERLEELSYKIDLKKYAIKELQDKIDEVRSDQDELTRAYEEQRSYRWRDLAPQILKVAGDLHMSYNVETNKFIYCMNMADTGSNNSTDIINPTFRTFDGTRACTMMSKLTGKLLNSEQNPAIHRLFFKDNRTHYMETASFFYNKWSKDKVYNKALIVSKFWVEPDFDNRENYNRDFDLLMYCIGGGKQENIDHLEQWPAYKLIFPERVGNTPNLDIGGLPGGNGKGRYGELCRTIFTHGCVQPAAAKELNDGFNATWEMATILLFDEPTEKELPAGKVKNATGGEEQRIERKGIDAYSADRNFSLLALSNNERGVFKLAGTGTGGEDRRYSVINTNIPLVDEIMRREQCDKNQAAIRANEIAQMVKDRKEVAKWLAHVILKHDVANMQILKPLHGEDYHTRFADQKSTTDTTFDEIMPVLLQQGAVSGQILADIFNAKTRPKTAVSSRNILKSFITYLNTNKIKFSKTTNNGKLNITWKGQTLATMTGTIIKFNEFANKFEWSKISSKMYHKGTALSNEDLVDFAEELYDDSKKQYVDDNNIFETDDDHDD